MAYVIGPFALSLSTDHLGSAGTPRPTAPITRREGEALPSRKRQRRTMFSGSH